jgi:hypothetical protein
MQKDFTAQQAILRRLEPQFQRTKRGSAAPRASNRQESSSTHSANAPAVPMTATDVSRALDEEDAAPKYTLRERRQPGVEAIQQVTSSGTCSSPRRWERVALGDPGTNQARSKSPPRKDKGPEQGGTPPSSCHQ